MNSKGSIFLDAVVGIVILSVLFIVLSNYTGFIFKAEKSLSSKLEKHLETNNLIEYIYSVEDWSNLNLSEVNYSYSHDDIYNVEVLDIEIENKNYKLERSSEREVIGLE